jgi:hypothetical protein
MPHAATQFTRLGLLASILCLACATGCGGPAYDALLNRRLDQLRAGAPFRSLFAPTQIPETPVSIRVPMAFRNSYTPVSGHNNDGGRIKPDRANPPFLNIPGLRLTYEGTSTDATHGQLPFYCYVGVVPNGDVNKLSTELQARLKETFKDTPEQWENVDATTPADTAVSWRKIRVEGDQPFYTTSQAEPLVLPGIFELWLHQAEGYAVLVGWRTPKSIEGPVPPPTTGENPLMQLTAEGKPDLQAMPALTAGTLKIAAADAAAK